MNIVRAIWLCFLIAVSGNVPGLAAQASELAGTWQSIGYGLYFTVAEDAVEIYQVTDVSCVRMVDVPEVIYEGDRVQLQNVTIAGLGQFIGTFDYELTLEDGLLNFEIGKVNPVQAQPVGALPSVCDELTTDTPENNFETFWHMYNEHYAFFDIRGVDWQLAYDTYRPQVTAETTEEELFAIFQEMVAPLKDGHVSVNTTVGSYTAINLPEWLGEGSEAEMESFIVDHALRTSDQYFIDEPKFTANDGILYGRLSDTVGYIGILTFDGSLTEAGDMQPLADAMTEILTEFQDMSAVVIDIRINFGGEDTNGFYIAGHFTDEAHLISNKSVWFAENFHPIQEVSIEPTTDAPFTGDVYLLTSRLTISAAETFALGMRELPNVTLIGEPTNGMLSDAWFVILPNGWITTLSNEQYLSTDGSLFEGVGVPPDVEIAITAEDFESGADPILEHALQLAR